MGLELPSFMKSKDVVGLDIGSSSIKMVQVKEAKQGWQLVKLGFAELPPEAIVDGSIIDSMSVADSIRNLIKENNVKATNVASALSGHSVIIKKVTLPAMTDEELSESIQWEAEQYIPFPISDVNIDFQILGMESEGTGQMDVMLVAVKKDVINDYVNVIKEGGLEPVVMDVDSFAIENMLEANYTIAPDENIVIVNVGGSLTGMSILTGGITVFTRAIPIGGNLFVEEIQKELNISFNDAETLKKGGSVEGIDGDQALPVIERVSGNLAVEIKRSVDFFLGGSPGIYVNKVFLGGGGAKTRDLSDTIQERVGIPVEIINPFNNINCNQKIFDLHYLEDAGPYFSVAVGLAMRRPGDR